MEVEVPNQEGGDGGVEVEGEECVHARLVVNVMVEGDDAEEGGAVMHVHNEQGRVAAQVVAHHQPPGEAGTAAFPTELPRVYHDLRTLVPTKVGVVDVPVGVCSPAQDVLSISFIIRTCHTNAGKPRLRHTHQVVCLVGCKKGVHSKIPPLHVDRKDGSYRHNQARV